MKTIIRSLFLLVSHWSELFTQTQEQTSLSRSLFFFILHGSLQMFWNSSCCDTTQQTVVKTLCLFTCADVSGSLIRFLVSNSWTDQWQRFFWTQFTLTHTLLFLCVDRRRCLCWWTTTTKPNTNTSTTTRSLSSRIWARRRGRSCWRRARSRCRTKTSRWNLR